MIALGDNMANEVLMQTLPLNDDVKRLIEIKNRIFQSAQASIKGSGPLVALLRSTGNWVDDDYLQG
jgi:hypothetical protein